MSAYPIVDRASDLIEALKGDQENFELSNHIFKNHNALKSVYEFFGLRSDLLEFAKDPAAGMEILGPEPRKPDLEKYTTDDEKERALSEYKQLVKIYEDRKKAMEMHVPYADYLLIESYLDKYRKTIHATSAVKGLRFKAFTKDVEHDEKKWYSGLFNKGNQQQ